LIIKKFVARILFARASPESSELRITVKAVKKWTFSQFANSTLKAGDVLEVGHPEGRIYF